MSLFQSTNPESSQLERRIKQVAYHTFDLRVLEDHFIRADADVKEADVSPSDLDCGVLFRGGGKEVFWSTQGEPAWVPRASWPTPREVVLLGRRNQTGGWVFGVEERCSGEEETRSSTAADNDDDLLSAIGEWTTVRALTWKGGPWVSLVGLGAAHVSWQGANRFCGACGSAMASMDHGRRRRCTTCQRKVYPRTNPVVIAAVSDGDSLLLGRGHHSRPKMFSCLAGFVEPCECVEAALIREVFEETGVRVASVDGLHSSQPWPIGRGMSCELMIGLRASAATGSAKVPPPKIDTTELEQARWFSRDELRTALSFSMVPSSWETPECEFCVPGPYAIAHHLIKDFVMHGDAADAAL